MPLPDDLSPDSERLAGQQISMIDAVRRQIDRIGYLRSGGHPWAEAVFQLRDMLVGLEDAQFWDGVPAKDRKRLLEAQASGDKIAAARIEARWKKQGWLGIPVRAVPGPGGRPIWRPTPENLSDLLRCIMGLLDRRKLLWKTRAGSELPPWLQPEANGVEETVE